ncbi:hypothetical protein ACCT09_49070, partial [Rhizobium ruizarguesonis]
SSIAMPAPYAAKPRVRDKPVSFSGAIFSIFSVPQHLGSNRPSDVQILPVGYSKLPSLRERDAVASPWSKTFDLDFQQAAPTTTSRRRLLLGAPVLAAVSYAGVARCTYRRAVLY